MKVMSRVLLFVASIIMSGCATTEHYARAVNSWQHASSRALVRAWGYPDHIERLSNGHQLYVYNRIDRGRYPTQVNPGYTSIRTEDNVTSVTSVPTTFSGGGSYDYRCKTWFELNGANMVVNTSFRGNNCLATRYFAERHTHRLSPVREY